MNARLSRLERAAAIQRVVLFTSVLAASLGAWTPTAAAAPQQCAPTISGTQATPDSAINVAVAGGVAYVADGDSGLVVIDVSDPMDPHLEGLVNTPVANDVAVAGDFAYVADIFGGLIVIDVSDPSEPLIVGSVDTPGAAQGVAVSGDLAYVADGFSGLQVIDVSDPTMPIIMGAVDTPDDARGVAVEGNIAYVADGDTGLVVIDVIDPTAPSIIGIADTPDSAFDVAVANGMAYVADDEQGLQIIDVSDPANPGIVGTLDTPDQAHGVAVAGNIAYIADGDTELLLVDVSDPTLPLLLASVDGQGDASGVAVSGDFAYVTGFTGLEVIDVSSCIPDPPQCNPTIVGSRGTSLPAFDLAVSGSVAYVAIDTEGLQLFDVSDPTNPIRRGTTTDPGLPGTAVGVAVSGSIAYVAVTVAGLQVIDVSDPDNPTSIGAVDTPGSTRDVAVSVSDSVAYLADGSSGLQVIDVSNPMNPAILGSVDTPDFAFGVAVSGGVAYVADDSSGLQVIDVSNPMNPTVIGSVDTPSGALRVAVSGSVAYLADSLSGLQVIDVSDPTAPTIVGSLDTPSEAYDVAVSGSVAYIVDGVAGLQVIDVSDPTDPILLGSVVTPELALGVDVSGSFAYVASDTGQLDVIDVASCLPMGCDTQLPVINCPSNMAVTCASAGGTIVDFDVTATDDCDPPPVVVCDPPSGSLFPPGFTTVTCTATNDFGETTCSFQINVVDHTPPVITCPPKTLVPCTSADGAVVSWDDPTATDDCDPNPVITCDPPEGTLLPMGMHTVVCTATDMFLNQSTCSFTVVVFDGVSPEISCPGQVRLECNGPTGTQVFFNVTATDDCDPVVDVVCVPPTGTTFPLGLTTVMCTATDDAGNISTCSFPVIIEDTVPPALTCPDNLSVACEDENGAIVNFTTPTASDLCDTMPSVVCDPASGTVFPMGPTLVTCTATDASGNSSECSFWVFVADVEAPVITCANIQAPCVDSNGIIVDLHALYTDDPDNFSVSDNCDDDPVLSFVPPSGSLFALGAHLVSATATDAAGNASTCVFTLIISDTTAPVIDCPLPLKVECDPHPGTRVDFVVTATDNCDPNIEVLCDPPSGSLFELGITNVVCTATDVAGNSSTCVFPVIAVDTQPPVIQCPEDIDLSCSGIGQPVDFPDPYVSDCDPDPTVVCDPPSGTVFEAGMTIVTCIATDSMGNSSSCTFTVTVGVDTEPPTFMDCIEPFDFNTACNGDVITYPEPTAVDDCDGPVAVVCIPPSGTLLPLGTHVIVCTATDTAGNAATCTFTVTVEDNSPPFIECPANITVECDRPGGAIVDYDVPIPIEACDPDPVVVCDLPPGAFFPLGENTVTCTASDVNGNSMSCSFMILVEDTTAPMITCPADILACSDPPQRQAGAVQEIGSGSGGFDGLLPPGSGFGSALTCLGDVDGDGIDDLAVGLESDDDGGEDCGAVWVLFLNGDGSVRAHRKISSLAGRFAGELSAGDGFGSALAMLDDLDGDGIGELAVGARGDATAGAGSGAVWILFLAADGTVKGESRITSGSAGFKGALSAGDGFGASLAVLEDRDGNGVAELVVGASGDDDGGLDRGALWLLSLDESGSVLAEQKLSSTAGGFAGTLGAGSGFGASVAPLGDLRGDGSTALAVGAPGAAGSGSTWILYLDELDRVTDQLEIASGLHGFDGKLEAGDAFGAALSHLGRRGANLSLAVAASGDDDAAQGEAGGRDRGAVWILELDRRGWVASHAKLSDAGGGFVSRLGDEDRFGRSLAALGDLNGDGSPELAAGGLATGKLGTGAVFVVSIEDVAGDEGAFVEFDPPQVSDSCDGAPTVVCDMESGDFFPVGTTTVTCTARDASDNSAECSFDVTVVVDDQAPEITCPQLGEVECNTTGGAFVDFEVTAMDDCPGEVTIFCSLPPDSIFPLGPNTVTCAAVDAAGNTAECTFSFDVVDTTAPDMTCFEDVVVECDSPFGTILELGFPEATDICDASVFVSGMVDEQGDIANYGGVHDFVLGTSEVILDAQDDSFNVTRCSFFVTVQDTTAPAITCIDPIEVMITSGNGAFVPFPDPLATDTCDNVPTVVCDPPSGSFFGLGTTSVTCTATDNFDNSTMCTFTVTVTLREDVTAPEVNCPGDMLMLYDGLADVGGTATMPVTYEVGVFDADPGTTLVCVPPSDSEFPMGVTTVVCTATDTAGNVGSCSFTVTVMPDVGVVDGSPGTAVLPFADDAGSGATVPAGVDELGFAELSAEGSNAATPPSRPGGETLPPVGAAGSEWAFRHPAGQPLLSFEASFLSAEAPGSVDRNDFLSVDVSDGVRSVNLYHADTFSALGEPDPDTGLRATRLMTVTADLDVLFPGSSEGTEFTLSAQVGNGGDDTLPSRALVDGFRFHGGARLRNGAGTNPVAFASAGTPVLGGEWRAVVDATAVEGASSTWIVVHAAPTIPGVAHPAGELLIDLGSPRWYASSLPVGAPASVHVLSIPDDLALLGLKLHAQAAILGAQPRLTNAIELELRE